MTKKGCKFEGSHYGGLVQIREGETACRKHGYHFALKKANQTKDPVKRKRFLERARMIIEGMGANESVLKILQEK